ncbi:DUF2867 domain-containing protein [Aquimarina algicola]|uniref:DUF2867 domain-containing protein n=1 Tax=Aquimarina algicola TaxID=2589995 RepID=A0A504JEQ6_9FLAO|nr:DUF2867 domain-containing protein [Aquimarina algicola]TPN86925.1 DUF2867 domain-containing protein [Aquimarina algicola]
MKKVKEEATPLIYTQTDLLEQIDFSDTFATTNQKNSLEEITTLIFNNQPNWIKKLFLIRNKIVKHIGLKTEITKDYNKGFRVGGFLSFFKIFSISDNKIVLGADDSHLNFRAIIANTNAEIYNIKVITLVQYNNTKGKIYMSIVKPFHKIIVKRMVKNAFVKS